MYMGSRAPGPCEAKNECAILCFSQESDVKERVSVGLQLSQQAPTVSPRESGPYCLAYGKYPILLFFFASYLTPRSLDLELFLSDVKAMEQTEGHQAL
jgi:hypothetical protein